MSQDVINRGLALIARYSMDLQESLSARSIGMFPRPQKVERAVSEIATVSSHSRELSEKKAVSIPGMRKFAEELQ
jgi:hypothetical protein